MDLLYTICHNYSFQLFRELQGVKDVERSGFLTKALNNGLEAGLKEVKASKKRAKLESCFRKVVQEETIQSCKAKYPDHMSQLDKYLGKYNKAMHSIK